MSKPIIAVTLGEPGGIGSEVARKALRDRRVRQACLPRIFRGSSFRSFRNAVDSALRKQVQAVVTAPISKAAWKREGSPCLDHTEYLSQWGGRYGVAMVMIGERLRIALATRHIPLARVAKELTQERILRVGKLLSGALRRWPGVPYPRLALCGLNPHAGEGGLLGREEERVLAPAARRLRCSGVRVEGPLACDSAMLAHSRGHYDGVIALYHDQALIPVKLLEGYGAAQWTVGIPFVRTSPAHGTAEDIAGKKKADPSGMVRAILLAVQLVRTGVSKDGSAGF